MHFISSLCRILKKTLWKSTCPTGSFTGPVKQWDMLGAVYVQDQYLIHVGGLVQERRNSIANALELRLSCTNPSM